VEGSACCGGRNVADARQTYHAFGLRLWAKSEGAVENGEKEIRLPACSLQPSYLSVLEPVC